MTVTRLYFSYLAAQIYVHSTVNVALIMLYYTVLYEVRTALSANS